MLLRCQKIEPAFTIDSDSAHCAPEARTRDAIHRGEDQRNNVSGGSIKTACKQPAPYAHISVATIVYTIHPDPTAVETREPISTKSITSSVSIKLTSSLPPRSSNVVNWH